MKISSSKSLASAPATKQTKRSNEVKKKILVVGAGFSGAVIARCLAERDYEVDVIDMREHIGGNAYDFINDAGIRIHKYGPHIFHTSNLKVVDWLSQFTKWIPYKHKVKAQLKNGSLVTLPVNQETRQIVGEENIIDTFYRPYTKKMWGMEIEKIDPEVISRVKVREDLNEYYFPDDTFQAMPEAGYTAIFEKILSHPRIKTQLNTKYQSGMNSDYEHVFNSMPIDEYFSYEYGELPYRSIKFHTHTLPVPEIYPVATVNFTHEEPYTRVTEWKKFPNHGSNPGKTTITIEEPCDYRENGYERYYPVKDIEGGNRALYKRYSDSVPAGMTFIGRCGLYAYLDMHQAISSAIEIAKRYQA